MPIWGKPLGSLGGPYGPISYELLADVGAKLYPPYSRLSWFTGPRVGSRTFRKLKGYEEYLKSSNHFTYTIVQDTVQYLRAKYPLG